VSGMASGIGRFKQMGTQSRVSSLGELHR
jgi:hypothetical protein